MAPNESPESSTAASPAVILAALLALAVLLAVVALVQASGDDPIQVTGATSIPTAPTSTTPAAGAAPTSTSTTITTGTTQPGAAVPTSTPGVVGTGEPITAPSTLPPAPVTTEVINGSPQCTPDQADQTVATDKTSYADGETVNVTATLGNHSTTACSIADPDRNCYTLLSAFAADGSGPYWRSGSVAPCPRRTLLPGASAVLHASWDQLDRRGCTPTSDPSCAKPRIPGPYNIRSGWLADGATTAITLT